MEKLIIIRVDAEGYLQAKNLVRKYSRITNTTTCDDGSKQMMFTVHPLKALKLAVEVWALKMKGVNIKIGA